VIRAYWERARQEWRDNRRLRVGALAILLVAGAHAGVAIGDRRAAVAEEYSRDLQLLQRLEEASREAAWPKRALQAEAALHTERERLPPVPSAGSAQAELQAWLADTLPSTGVRVETVQVEAAVDVPDYPGLWQVPARVDVVAPLGTVGPFVRVLSEALPWVQTERIEASGEGETRVSVIVRGYYRKGPRKPMAARNSALKENPAGTAAAPAPDAVRNDSGTEPAATSATERQDRDPSRATRPVSRRTQQRDSGGARSAAPRAGQPKERAR